MPGERGFELLDKIPVAVSISNLEGDLIYVNESFEVLFGFRFIDFQNKSEWLIKFFPDAEYRKFAIEFIRNAALQNDKVPDKKILNFSCFDKSVKNIELSFTIDNGFVYTFYKDIAQNILDNTPLLPQSVLLTNIINSYPGMFFFYKKEGEKFRLKLWNKVHEQLLGYSSEEILNREPGFFFGPENTSEFLRELKKLPSNSNFESEISIVNKSGSQIPCTISLRTFLYNNEDYLTGTAFDISDLKITHEALEKNRLFSKKLADDSPNFIYIYDIESGENIYMNRDLGNYLGYNEDEIPGKTEDFFRKFMHPDDYGTLEKSLNNFDVFSGDFVQTFEYKIKSKDGQWKWFFGQEKEFERKNGKLVSLLGNLTDITENKINRIALLESEEKFRTLVEALPDIIIVLDYNQNILYSNIDLQNKSENQAKEWVLYEGNYIKIHPDDTSNIREFVEKFIKSNEKTLGPLIIRYTDNVNSYWFRRVVTKINYHGQDALQSISTDITNLIHAEEVLRENENALMMKNEELKHLNIELRQSYEKLKETNEALQIARIKAQESDILKTAFLQNMSHEIRTPLNGILGFSNLIAEPGSTKEQQKYYSKIITESSEQLLNIVDDIINVSKLETGQSEIVKNIVRPKQLITDLFEDFTGKAEEKNISLDFHTESSMLDFSIITDEGKLKQIIANLISNAIKYTSSGKVEAGYVIEQMKVKFWISDTGVGIAKENFRKIFDRFFQIDSGISRAYGGTGLGLTIAKANSELLGGNIWVESEVGKGSTFSFYIEYVPVEIPKSEKSVTPYDDLPATKPITVLVAEDEEYNYLFLKEILSEFNYTLIHAVNGREAVEKFTQHPEIDLVLMDIKMPEMSGFEALEIIKLQRSTIPVIAQTAYAFFSDRQKALNAGFDEYISKPIKKEELLKLINKSVNHSVY